MLGFMYQVLGIGFLNKKPSHYPLPDTRYPKARYPKPVTHYETTLISINFFSFFLYFNQFWAILLPKSRSIWQKFNAKQAFELANFKVK